MLVLLSIILISVLVLVIKSAVQVLLYGTFLTGKLLFSPFRIIIKILAGMTVLALLLGAAFFFFVFLI